MQSKGGEEHKQRYSVYFTDDNKNEKD